MARTLTVTMPSLHPAQLRVQNSPARFKILATGRRFGKTMLGALLCLESALKGGRAWWVAPSYKVAAVGWRAIKHLGQQIPGAEKRDADRMMIMPGGGYIQVRSADEPDSLRGEGLNFVVMDECAFIQEAAWTEAIRPALSDKQGGALLISTPKGKNWFWRLHCNATTQAGWASWTFPTGMNPFIAATEIEDARRSLPERIFLQEYLAEFVEDSGVFRNVMAAAVVAKPDAQESHIGHHTVMGCDWAKKDDFTALTVICRECSRVVDWDHFNQIDYAVQRQRLAYLATKWNVETIEAESNSIGEPNIEMLRRDGLPVRGFETTATSKPPLIESLVLAVERGEIQVPHEYALELQAYELQTNKTTGRPSYSAPYGMHDDRVISLALAWRAASTTTNMYILSMPIRDTEEED